MQSSAARVLTLFCGLVAVSDVLTGTPPFGSRGPKKELLNSICSTAADPDVCAITAGRCVFKPPAGVKDAFCKCKDSVVGVNALYTTWVAEGGRDKCTVGESPAEGHHHSGTHTSFYDYLKTHGNSGHLFECCIGLEQGLFSASGAVQVAAWEANAASITDQAALAAVKSAIQTCANSGTTTCSPKDVALCVVKSCFNTLSG